jgi:hypothetical protein
VETNIVERGRSQMAIWRMRIACWITKATNTHSQYVILIALPLQQWLRERAPLFRYTYIDCLNSFQKATKPSVFVFILTILNGNSIFDLSLFIYDHFFRKETRA